MNVQPILDHFAGYSPLSEQEVNDLVSRLSERRIKKRQFILSEGDVCKHYTFVVQGCFRMYKVDQKGNEHNVQFTIENGWIGDIGSFHSEVPSEMYVEAMEPSIVLQLEKPDLIHLYLNYINFNRNFRVLIENAFIRLQQRMLLTISSSAEEKYLDFLRNHPHLFNRISNVQIASYIGVTPEFLSKVRKDISLK